MSTGSFELTSQQKQFFDTFGFLGLPGLVADIAPRISDEFESIWANNGGGHHGQPHAGKERSCIVPFIDQNEFLSALLDDPRIHGLAAGLLGDDFNYMGSDGNYYVGDTPWHSDGWHRHVRQMKIAFYLDPLTRDTGALRVIPGSHRAGDRFSETLQNEIHQCEDLWGAAGAAIPSVALDTNLGDVVCFDHNTKHASFGGNKSRRMFTINLAAHFPEEHLVDLRGYISYFARFWIDDFYGDAMLRTAGPERRIHLGQILANSDHLPGLAAEARQTMSEPARG